MAPATLTQDHVLFDVDNSPATSDTHTDDDQQRQTPPDEQVTQFHITGFKQFYNVPVNPTELILNALPEYLSHNPLSPSVKISSTNVFTVAAKTTLREVSSMYRKHADENNRISNNSGRTVFIHLGVNMSTNKFFLEYKAKNEATFSCPDELGWTPIRNSIDPDNSDITCTRKTALDLQFLRNNLRSLHYDVDISHDAGRFVCNWVYYNSLKLSKENGTHALFVHVPPTACIPLNRQVEFVASLLEAISMLPHDL